MLTWKLPNGQLRQVEEGSCLLPFAQELKDSFVSPVVEGIFKGLRPASIGLITSAFLGVVKESLLYLDKFTGLSTLLSVFNWKGIVLAAALFFLMKKWKKHPIVYIAIAAAVGIVFSF